MVTAGGRTFCPVSVGGAEAWVTVRVWLPAASPGLASTVERPMLPAPLLSRKGPEATGVVSVPTVLAETDDPALATLVTLKRALPGRAAGPVVPPASVGAEDVPVVLPQADCLVMESGTNALAAVCSAVISEFRPCIELTRVWLAVLWLVSCCSGSRSTCISWVMICVVFSPEMRPSMAPMAVPFSGWSIRANGQGADREGPPRGRSGQAVRSAEELEHRLRGLVGLRQHRDAGLLQDLAPGEGGHLLGHVGVADAGLCGSGVLSGNRQAVDGVLQTVLDRTQVSTLRGDPLDGLVDADQRCVSASLGRDVECVD